MMAMIVLFMVWAQSAVAQLGPASRAFHRLKALEGSWRTAGPQGERVRVDYEIVSGGRAVLERVTGVAEHGPSGMMSLYYLAGDRLAMSHFCSAGNQPRFRADAVSDSLVSFELVPGSVATAAEGHIHAVVFRFGGPNRIETDWDWWQGEALDHRLTRQQERVRR